MAISNQRECRGYLLSDSGQAIQVCKDPMTHKINWWIPRSQIGYLRKTYTKPGEIPYIVFTIPEWLVEDKQCWELVP